MDLDITNAAENQSFILWLAPLHGLSGKVFRKAWLDHFSGIDIVLAPFILTINVDAYKETHFKDLRRESAIKVPLVPQILGNNAEGFIQTARVLSDMGYDEVNWNLGCPYPMVTKKKRGSGLLPYPDMVRTILDSVCPGVSMPVSVKLRLGLDDKREILDIIPVLNEYPLKRIIVHPRIGTQMYSGSVDLEAFTSVVGLSRQPLVYNGDIRDVDTFKMLRDRFPSVHEWMIGRWAVINPFLPAIIKSLPLPVNPAASIEAFHKDLYLGYREVLQGSRHVLDKMKEVWSYLGLSYPGCKACLKAIHSAKTLETYEHAVQILISTAYHNN